jgi:hypothetical protein
VIDSSNKCTGFKMYTLTDNLLLDVSVMVYTLVLLGINILNCVRIIAVMNFLIDNTNICTSVYQSVHRTFWYTLVHMLVLSIKQFVTAMI